LHQSEAMKILNTLYVLAAFAILTSCKSLHTLAAKDVSNTSKPQNIKQHGKVSFIENIEVSPGSVVTSKHKTINTNTKNKQENKVSTQTVTYTKPNEVYTKSTIENADYLQLKYAVILDATVERLTNLLFLQVIDKWWGTKYCLGGSTEQCIDCSAFTQTIARDVFNTELPRTSQEQYNYVESIETNELAEGDLVFFHSGGKRRRVSHVGFYVMNNKFVHASTSNGVMISDLDESYWKRRYKGAGRLKKNFTATSKN
jgi:cell wall-associated NlpC family hydrolase